MALTSLRMRPPFHTVTKRYSQPQQITHNPHLQANLSKVSTIPPLHVHILLARLEWKFPVGAYTADRGSQFN